MICNDRVLIEKVTNGFVTQINRGPDHDALTPSRHESFVDTSKLRVLRRVAKALGIEGTVVVQEPAKRKAEGRSR